jgi:hypothetical protein
MRHPNYSVRYCIVQINSPLLTITLYSGLEQHSCVTTQIIFCGVITEFDCNINGLKRPRIMESVD